MAKPPPTEYKQLPKGHHKWNWVMNRRLTDVKPTYVKGRPVEAK